jgi:hypothetical protein
MAFVAADRCKWLLLANLSSLSFTPSSLPLPLVAAFDLIKRNLWPPSVIALNY